MRHITLLRLTAGLAAALLGSPMCVRPAYAQTLTVSPNVPPAVTGCVLVGDLGPCIAAMTPVTPISVFPGMGSRNVDVDKHVDRSREHGRVMVR